MKKNQVLTIIGGFCSCVVIASSYQEVAPFISSNNSYQKEFTQQVKKTKRKKKKSSMSLAFKVCIRALEETFKDLLNKEIAHILSQLPMWIDRLGTRAIPVENEDVTIPPHKILSFLQFVKDKFNADSFFKKPDSYLQKLWQYNSHEDRVEYLEKLLSSYDESLLFFDELFHVLLASLTPLQQQQVEAYCDSVSEKEDEAKRNPEASEIKKDNQTDKNEALGDHED